MSCLKPEELADLLERGGLQAADDRESDHLASCADCRAAWGEIASADALLSPHRGASTVYRKPKTQVWGILTMAASLLIFGMIVFMISSPPPGPGGVLGQDSIEDLIEQLGSDDLAEREEAIEALNKTTFDKLSLLEKALEHEDHDIRLRVADVFAHVLERKLTKKNTDISIRLRDIGSNSAKWRKGGMQDEDIPEGFEIVKWNNQGLLVMKDDGFKPGHFTNVDMIEGKGNANGQLGASSGSYGQGFSFEFTDEGLKKLKELQKTVAGTANNRRMNYAYAVVFVSGKPVASPLFRPTKQGEEDSKKYTANCYVKGAAKKAVLAMTDKWTLLTFRVESNRKDGDLEIAQTLVRGTKGLEGVVVKADENGLSCTAPIGAEASSLVPLWRTLKKTGYKITPLQ